MKTLVTIIALTLSLLLGSMTFPLAYTSAQDIQTDPNMGQGTLNDPPTATTDDNTGFDWRWLLPLLAIPLLFLVFKRDDREDRSGQYRGAKGGRSQQDTDDPQ